MERLPNRLAIKCSKQPAASICSILVVSIERNFDTIGRGDDGRLFQPHTMLDAVQMQHRVPAVRSFSQLSFVEVSEIEADVRIRARRQLNWSDRNDRRQHLWRPEDCLFE